ncbi:MAG: hemerythrin family protein [Betaproteobacteria bacterium]
MDQKFILGIVELDSQHEEIEKILMALQDAIDNKDRWHVLHFILENLYEKLVFHFSFEEAVMQIFSYPEAEEHSRAHRAALASVENYKKRSVTSTDMDSLGTPPVQLIYDQIITHDLKFATYIKGLMERLGI